MKWQTKALTSDCLTAAKQVETLPWLQQFYLAGGTALALWYGHRISVDLDFFSSSNPLNFAARQTIVKDLRDIKAEIEEEKEGTLQARLGLTHISFFKYVYPLLRPTQPWGAIPVADPLDIALMKIGAIIGRGSKKDFYDLAAILKSDYKLPQLFRFSKDKFEGHRDYWLQASRALVYFDDADREPAPKLINAKSWPEIKIFIEQEVRKFVGKQLPN